MSGLTTITIPEGVASIGSLAFDGCSALTSITILSKGFTSAMKNVEFVTMGKGNNDILNVTEEALDKKVSAAISKASVQAGGRSFIKGGAPKMTYTDTGSGELLLNQ